MTNKTPSQFGSHNDWLGYVELYVPTSERAYALAAGRTELFKRFYELREWQFPAEFSIELDRIHERGELECPTDLELLNQQILGNLTTRLFNDVPSAASTKRSNPLQTPR